MRIAVVVFPGTNCDEETRYVIGDLLGQQVEPVWHAETDLGRFDTIVLPGGFSYGDHLRAGAIARFSPVMKSVAELARRDRIVVGICNGFQVLCESGLLPGILRSNQSLSFVCRDTVLTVERADTPFTSRCHAGQRISIPVKHGEGCYFADDELLAELRASAQVVLRYVGETPNGAVDGIAGVVSAEGNVLGLMPHPEHAVDPLIGAGSSDGALILGSLVDAARDRIAVSV
jgi:phosphoribosylformylglycinamidine synthase